MASSFVRGGGYSSFDLPYGSDLEPITGEKTTKHGTRPEYEPSVEARPCRYRSFLAPFPQSPWAAGAHRGYRGISKGNGNHPRGNEVILTDRLSSVESPLLSLPLPESSNFDRRRNGKTKYMIMRCNTNLLAIHKRCGQTELMYSSEMMEFRERPSSTHVTRALL